MIRRFFYRLLLHERLAGVVQTMYIRSQCVGESEIERFQVKRFNMIWRIAQSYVPFYMEWKRRYQLPNEIENLSDLLDWPVLTKADLRHLVQFERSDVSVPKGELMTGGSTGEPVRLPSWGDSVAGISQLLGRRAYGIEPGDRTVLLWGHEHLYGTGWRRKVNTFKRRVKDWLAGWTRISAYDLSDLAMQRAYGIVERAHPKFLIGFSSAILAFVRQNRVHAHELTAVKVILCTAGPLTPDEKQEIIDFFTATASSKSVVPKLCMEYGSVECGVMAYTRPRDGEYDVFWNTHLLQAPKQPDGEYKNLVTRLTDCYVPLIRYDVGDYLELDPADDEQNARSVLEIKSVKGRPNEMLKFRCGVSFFGALIGDCVKQVPEIISSQIAVDEENDVLEIRVTAKSPLPDTVLSLVVNRFTLTVADTRKLTIRVVQVEKLFTTVGGKVPRVVRIQVSHTDMNNGH